MMTTDERLIAYVDGELADEDRAAFEAEMAADPSLAAEVERHRRLRALIGGAYAPVLEEPVPPQLTAAASVANDPAPRRFGPPQWAAMAACLVAGVLVGRVAMTERSDLVLQDGRLVARGELAQALSGRLASEPGAVAMGISFRRADGRYCRTFTSQPDRLAGLACREGETWVAQAASAWTPAASEYRTAGSETPPAVLAAVDQLMAGEALDAAGERAARKRGWKPD